MTLTVEDVADAAQALLLAQTPIDWYMQFAPDDVEVPNRPYGVLDVYGPLEVSIDEWSIGAVSDQSFQGRLLATVTAPTYDALKVEAARAAKLLRGWSPDESVGALFTYDAGGGFNTPFSKYKPTLFVRSMSFEFVVNPS